jgi:hypothetical protein
VNPLIRLQQSVAAHRKTHVDTDLREEVERPPAWMYAWQLGRGIVTPVLGPELPDIHRTRLAQILQ